MKTAPFLLLLLLSLPLFPQAAASLSGSLTDPSGAPVASIPIVLANSLTGYEAATVSGQDGGFSFVNVPFQTYSLSISQRGFEPQQRTVALRSNIPVHLDIQLQVARISDTITVSATERRQLVDTEATGTRTELSRTQIERIPAAVGARGLEGVLVSSPGFAQNANGAIHPRGAHNQMTYVIDGMPISDQFTGSFATSLDPAIVQSIELFTGDVPPEYGNKVSGVANITTRSGFETGRKFTGTAEAGAGGFDTLSGSAQVGGAIDRFGYFASISSVKSNRFLDQVSLSNLHNGGNAERAFTRLDYQLNDTDFLRLNLMAGRSSFEVPNLRSQHWVGMDQGQLLRDFSAALGYVKTLSPVSTFDSTTSYRTSVAQLFPSAGDTPVTAASARHLTSITMLNHFNRIVGPHTFRLGVDYQQVPLSEDFSFAITDPAFNSPGDPAFIPTLLAHDLSRGGRLFSYSGKFTGRLHSGVMQDKIRWGPWLLNIGARWDAYRFLVNGNQLQPRVGVAYHLEQTGTVFRASYNRLYQTPPNENLLLSNSEAAAALVPPDVRDTLGAGVIRIRPQRENVYEVGVQQRAGKLISVNAVVYHKNSVDMQDNDNFFNTGIIFPTTLAKAKVNGAEARVAMPEWRGFSGAVSLTHYRAVVTPPFSGGLFLGNTAVSVLNQGPFIIDHDQALGVHALAFYRSKKGWWTSWSMRYDSGLVSNPSNPAEVAADPDFSDLLPYVNLGANPPRVRPRTVADASVGYEFRSGERSRWEIVGQVLNLNGATALYNFQSVFVGTRLLQPRTLGVRLRWHF